jgi:hypothetical protein
VVFFRWVILGGFFGWVFYCQPCLAGVEGALLAREALANHLQKKKYSSYCTVFVEAVFRIHKFLGLPDPDPSISKQN